MRKAFLGILLSGFIFVSCSKDIDVPEPIRQLTKTTSCNGCEPYVDAYRWRGSTVYIFSCKGPTCFCGVSYYDEDGLTLNMEAGYTFNEFRQESKLLKNIWTCKG